MTPSGFDQEADGVKWREQGARIAAGLPLDPISSRPQEIVDEWFALLKPFSNVATPETCNRVVRMCDEHPGFFS